jgi:hypothetical protein
VVDSKEAKILEEVKAWFESLRHLNRLEPYEHGLFIAAADWLWDREEAIEEWIPDNLVQSLPPSVIESLRVSMELDVGSHLKLTRVPTPSMAAQFDVAGLPEGAHLAAPRMPSELTLPVKDLESSVPAPPPELPTVPDGTRMAALVRDMIGEDVE